MVAKLLFIGNWIFLDISNFRNLLDPIGYFTETWTFSVGSLNVLAGSVFFYLECSH